MADEHFFPGPGDFPAGLGAAPFFGSASYAPPGLDAAAAAMQGFGLAWADLQLPDSSGAAAHFDSALSSLVSSPSHNAGGGYGAGGDDVAIIGDLIGRLGGICGAAAAASASNSCYSTPLSSPPRGGAASPAAAAAASLAFRGGCCGYPGGAAALETAGTGRLSRVASSKSFGAPALGSPDAAPPAKKRKASGKGKATSSAMTPAAAANASSKRSKVAAGGGAEGKDDDGGDNAAAAPEPEPAKGYIHVRARRGQATDSHSLAERVRRERISERMKMLQSLVPGCNKITGKALMLDEIINYVQSLQRQVEFLSMKLSTMNPELDLDARYQTAVLAPPHHQPAAEFPSYAAAAADPSFVTASHPPAQQQQQQLVDSCAGSFRPGSGWEAQDLQSVVARHNHSAAAAVHGHDLSYAPQSSPAAHESNSHGAGQQQQQQQGAAAASHMKLEQP
ncbi:hypothetical protein SEVIR_7G065725v4 [Setaria viridis]|nr:transcription factor bHLH78-like [Setaria viridis]